MARGFGGETTEQEARGNEGLSVADVASGRADAATSAAIGGRDVDPGAGDGDNYTANDYIPNMARVNEVLDYRQKQEAFNLANGITDANPFGRLSRGVMGFAINKLGLDPKHVSYPSLSLSQRRAIANNQFSKFMNPQNKPGEIVNNRASDLFTGYNPNFPTAKEGELRSGVQYDGYKTQYGDVMSQAREQSTGEMTARGLAGLLGGPVGMALGQIGTKEYGLPGQPGFEDFDPNNPRPGGGILGQIFGGVNPTQAAQKAAELKQSIIDEFTTPNLPGPVATSSSGKFGADADLRGFEERFGNTHPLSGETTNISPDLDKALQAYQDTYTYAADTDTGQYFGGVDDEMGDIGVMLSGYTPDEFSGVNFNAPRGNLTPTELEGLIKNSTTPKTAAEELALIDTIGGFLGRNSVELSPEVESFLDEHGMTRQELLDRDFSKVPDGARLPSGQIMSPEFRPDQSSSLGSPLSGGIIQLAGATGGTDVTNMTQDERGMYRVGRESNIFEKALESLGLKESTRRPKGQFYSPSKSPNFFSRLIGAS